MNPESLIASASINIGLAMVVLSLFSILKKQPSKAPIYYAKRLSLSNDESFHHQNQSCRFLPSVSWISKAFHVSETEILLTSGLDALVVIRLFKFGIKFFVVCSLIGIVILLPVNYNGHVKNSMTSNNHHSMDLFTISNISRGSNKLWIHFACLWFISLYGLYQLHKEYNEILIIRIQQLRHIRHRPDQFTVLIREIPFCNVHNAHACCADHFFSIHYPHDYLSYQILYTGKDVEDLVSQAKLIARKIDDLKERSIARQTKRGIFLLKESEREKERLALLEEKLECLRLKIHQLQCENTLKQKEFPVAFVTFKTRVAAALVAQSQQHSNPLLWISSMAPEPRDVSWRNLTIPSRLSSLCKLGAVVAASVLTIFFVIPVTAVQGIAKFEKLKTWFPPAMAVQFIPGLSSIVTGYLPSAILKGFIYIVPFAMLGMAKLPGSISKSKEEIKTCNMVFYFLVGNVFFLSLLSGSLLDQIGESFTNPKNFPTRLASAVSAQADFFLTYILTDGLSGFSFEILQPGLLLWSAIRFCFCRRSKEKNPYLFSLPYYRVIPLVSLSILIGMVYAVVAPLLLPFLIGYFCLGYAVFINQIEDVYDIVYETCGKYWPYIHHYILVSIILMQITMIGLFGLKSKPAAAISTIPLLILTLMFNEYCKIRFLPSFRNFPIQSAMENDELDMKSNELEINYKNASKAYSPPCLQSFNSIESLGSTSTSSSSQPLVTTS
ncbi:CSC1-like protein At3g54510 isoform X1 [Cannabis sativa]|uniref:CSC1-like protein At3g54510 isoform X1 n=1 Tax=Cannabis sativa TaxID=3483 RepID=UPI0029CA80A8|nr:CSC1-like protein At3g54510 isoform X1 [Cannabis sativa]